MLIAIDWFTPAYRAGGPVRSIENLVQWLGSEWQIDVLTSDRDWGQAHPLPGIQTDHWVQQMNCRVRYVSQGQMNYTSISRLLNEGNYDGILLNSMFSRPFTQWPLQWRKQQAHPPKVILAPRGMLRPGALAIKPLKKKVYLALMKWRGWHQGLTFLATGSHEVEDVRRVFGSSANVVEVPNLSARVGEYPGAMHKVKGEAVFISVGRITAVKNTLASLQALAQVKGKVQLHLLGPMGESAYWQQCEKAIAQLPESVQVKLHGEKPPGEVAAALAQAHFLLLPSVSENFGHAIVEALAAGRPAIISDQTPWRQLQMAEAGWDVELKQADALAKALQEAIDMDGAQYERWSRGAWNFAVTQVQQPGAVAQWRRVFD